MGKHYVPQEYLRGFATPGDRSMIWMFDKVKGEWSRDAVAIKRVAQEADFYDDDTERELRVIESPAHQALSKLRVGPHLSMQDRQALAAYIACMINRGPRGKRRAAELVGKEGVVDEVLEAVRRRFIASVAALGRDLPEAAARVLDDLGSRYRAMAPAELAAKVHTPWPGPKMLAAVSAMTWRVIVTAGPSFFLTSDTPAVFFEGMGLGDPLAELTFPLSTDLALLASWCGPAGVSLAITGDRKELVKEVNRRVAAGAERFVFYHRRATWVKTLACRPNPYLSRIGWPDCEPEVKVHFPDEADG